MLGPVSPATLGLFLDIELPRADEPGPPAIDNWNTIGQFYAGVAKLLHDRKPTYRRRRQMSAQNNPGAGKLIAVTSEVLADAAMATIVVEGEGFSNKPGDAFHERAHYYKFQTVEQMLSDGRLEPGRDVFPLVTSPSAQGYTPAQQEQNRRFNVVYSQLLDSLQAAFTSDAPEAFGAPTRLMDALGHLAAVLRDTDPGATLAGPTFEYLPQSQR